MIIYWLAITSNYISYVIKFLVLHYLKCSYYPHTYSYSVRNNIATMKMALDVYRYHYSYFKFQALFSIILLR